MCMYTHVYAQVHMGYIYTCTHIQMHARPHTSISRAVSAPEFVSISEMRREACEPQNLLSP